MDNLFIAVKICNISKIVVVPIINIFKLDLVKSLNNRINRNQIHLMFWSNDQEKDPDFDLPISTHFNESVDACFNVMLLKVFDNHSLAMKYRESRRKIDPAVYNVRRLQEKPFPATQSRQNIQGKQWKSLKTVEPRLTEYSTMDTPPVSPAPNIEETDDENLPPNSPMSIIEENNLNPEEENELNLESNNGTNIAIQTICNKSTDDVFCLSDPKIQHRPIKEFDVISGRYTFLRTPKGDRIYDVNGQRFKLNKGTVDRLLYYNKSPTSTKNQNIDKTFVELLLLSIVDVSDLKQNKIGIELLNIIKNIYKNRVGRDKVRLENFKNYVKTKCQELNSM